MTVSRFDARRLDDWAALHGHTIEPDEPETFACPKHGPYVPFSLIDGDCPTCEADDYRGWRNRRYDIADAAYDARATQALDYD